MPKKGGGIAAYNAIISAIKGRTGVSHKEAQQTYRAASVRLGKPPSLTEARRGAAIAKEAARAGRQIAEKRRAEIAKVERANERARQPRRKDKTPVVVEPPAKKGGRERGADRGDVGGGGGGGGGGGRAGGGGPDRGRGTDYDADYVDLEPPDEIGGEDGDYPDGV